MVRGGGVPSITVSARGESLEELGRLENILIRGRMEQGRIFIPFVELDLDDVYGDVVIAGGILEGAACGPITAGRAAKTEPCAWALRRPTRCIQLDICPARRALAPLPALLARVVPDPAFRKEVGARPGILRHGPGDPAARRHPHGRLGGGAGL
ncbi:MAG: hypothetical protein MZV70_60695 [Desulfobacterales bacterium]|nr:hypothetical protein [Desulfobacterales bacterium]